jgi:hypothetical protein
MNFHVPDQPARRAVVSRQHWGIGNRLVSVTLECGHERHGLANWPSLQGDVLDCWPCVIVADGTSEKAKQLSLFQEGMAS